MTVSPSKHYSGHHKSAEEENDPALKRATGEGNADGGIQVQLHGRKMDAAAQDRAGLSRVVCGVCSTSYLANVDMAWHDSSCLMSVRRSTSRLVDSCLHLGSG